MLMDKVTSAPSDFMPVFVNAISSALTDAAEDDSEFDSGLDSHQAFFDSVPLSAARADLIGFL